MKNIFKNGKKLLVVLIFSSLTFGAFAQTATPPPPNTGSNNASNQVGGGAPVGSGALILFTFAMAYGGKRFYDFRKKANAET